MCIKRYCSIGCWSGALPTTVTVGSNNPVYNGQLITHKTFISVVDGDVLQITDTMIALITRKHILGYIVHDLNSK